MASNYPNGLDAFTNPTGTDKMNAPTVLHDAQHASINDAMEAVQGELGTNPSGSAATVTARLANADSIVAGKADTGHTHTGLTPAAHAATHAAGGGDAVALTTAQVTGLDTALAGKAPTVHTHTTAQVTGLDTTLAGKSPLNTVSTTAPASPATGQVWYDSTTTPYVGKVWTGSAWQIFSQAGSGGGLTWAAATGGTETTFTGNGTNGEAGKTYKVHEFTANGTLTVSKTGLVEVMILGPGGDGGSDYGGGGGDVRLGMFTIPAGALAVTVGQRITSFGGIAPSSLGTIVKAHGANQSGGGNTTSRGVRGGTNGGGGSGGGGAGGDASGGTPGVGVTSLITGTAVEYGKGGVVNGAGNPSTTGNGRVIVRYQV